MVVTISRWGNSLGVRIPKHALEEANLREGDRVLVACEGGRLIVSRSVATESLDDLLDRITPENRHAEIVDGFAGNELW